MEDVKRERKNLSWPKTHYGITNIKNQQNGWESELESILYRTHYRYLHSSGFVRFPTIFYLTSYWTAGEGLSSNTYLVLKATISVQERRATTIAMNLIPCWNQPNTPYDACGAHSQSRLLLQACCTLSIDFYGNSAHKTKNTAKWAGEKLMFLALLLGTFCISGECLCDLC